MQLRGPAQSLQVAKMGYETWRATLMCGFCLALEQGVLEQVVLEQVVAPVEPLLVACMLHECPTSKHVLVKPSTDP